MYRPSSVSKVSRSRLPTPTRNAHAKSRTSSASEPSRHRKLARSRRRCAGHRHFHAEPRKAPRAGRHVSGAGVLRETRRARPRHARPGSYGGRLRGHRRPDRLPATFRRRVRGRACSSRERLGRPNSVDARGHTRSVPSSAAYIAASGGIYRDLHIHDFDAIRFVSGEEVTQVYADGAGLDAPWIDDLEDVDVAATALPTIVGDLGGTSHVSWVVTAYLLASTVTGPLYGKLGDLYGRKLVLQVGDRALPRRLGAVRARARAWCELIAFRAIQGLGAGGLIVHDDRRDRRRRPAARARPLPGLLRRRLRRGERDRAADRRLLRRQPLLALDLLRQPADRRVALGVIGAVFHAPRRARCGTRSTGSGVTLLAGGLSAVILFTSLGGTTYAWSSHAGSSSCSRPAVVLLAAVRRRRALRDGAAHAALALPQPHLRRLQRDRLRRSAWRCSGRSSTCRSTCRSSRARARPAAASS